MRGSGGLRSQAILIAVLTIGAVTAIGCLRGITGHAATTAGEALHLPPLLSTAQLRAVAGGFAPALADTYWIRVISTSDTTLDGTGGAERAYALVERVTALDPQFEPAYHYGALIIGVRALRPDLADRLLARAERIFPENWNFPFYRGFLRLYHMDNLHTAAGHMARAASLPGSPPFLSALARRLREQENDPRLAIELIERMLRSVDDKALQARMRARRDALLTRMAEQAS